MPKSIIIIAGEASGDLHGYNLIKAIKQLDPDVKFTGIGGKRMRDAGLEPIASSSDMAVVGFTEVFAKLRNIIRAGIRVKRILRDELPDLLILIDYPDFNLHIAGYAKKVGIPVMYYISPQVWAWRTGRVKKIRERVNRMVVVLPFEKDFYEKRGVKVSYVGHPIMDVIPENINGQEMKKLFKADPYYPIIGILPGSRKEEIKNTLPFMLTALSSLKNRYKNLVSYLPVASTLDLGYVKKFIKDYPFVNIISHKDIYSMLSICDIAFVTSGTASLETAVMGVPMIVLYKGSAVSFWIAKMLVKIKYISLPNLIAGEEIVPEILQDRLTPEVLQNEAVRILDDSKVRKAIIAKLKGVKDLLGKGGVSIRAAKIAMEIIG